jgi:thioredoxin-related protein
MKSFNYKYAFAFLVLLGVFALAIYLMKKESVGNPTPVLLTWNSFDVGFNLAKNTEKKVLVDVYTDWCGWCKKMDSEVYTDREVVKLINDHFILVKLNAESGNSLTFRGKTLSEADLAHELGVSGYPTTLFFDYNANPITDFPGYAAPERFSKVLDFIGKDYYKTVSFQEYVQRQPSNQ